METRQTIQKLKIMQHLQSVKTHPSAEMIYNAVKEEVPTITLATVYRNLNFLAGEGKILKLEINNEFRFDGDISKHQHCVCKKCGCIKDLFQEEISEYALKKISHSGFQPEAVNVIFMGLCDKCCIQKGIE